MYTWTPHKTTKQCVTGMHTKDDHQLTYKPPAPDNLDQWRDGLGGGGGDTLMRSNIDSDILCAEVNWPTFLRIFLGKVFLFQGGVLAMLPQI